MKMNLGVVLALIFLFLVFIGRRYRIQSRRIEESTTRPSASHEPSDLASPSPPETFGYKTAWFAIRSEDPKSVAAALELVDVQSVNWRYGVAHAYGDTVHDLQVFVTPPVRGWVLAMGTPILYEADDHARVRMLALSKQFGEAQFFGSMRISGVYVWGRASKGTMIRFFYEGDGTRRVEGDETQAERELKFQFFDASSPEAKQPDYWQRKDLKYPDEECVQQIAGKWSVDPEQLKTMSLEPSLGLLGSPSASYPSRGK